MIYVESGFEVAASVSQFFEMGIRRRLFYSIVGIHP